MGHEFVCPRCNTKIMYLQSKCHFCDNDIPERMWKNFIERLFNLPDNLLEQEPYNTEWEIYYNIWQKMKGASGRD